MVASSAPTLDTPELLRLGPKVALCTIANYHNNQTVSAGYVNISDPVVLSGRRTRVTFTPNAQAQSGGRTYLGSYTLDYNRLDLGVFFDELAPEVEVNLPCTALDVVRALGTKYDIVFDEGEIEQRQVGLTDTSVIISAASTSLRWIGEIEVGVVFFPSLQNVINPKDLPGFDMFDVGSGLQDNIPQPALDGFTKPDLFDYVTPGILAGHWTSVPTNMVTDTGLSSEAMFLQALKAYSGVQFGISDFEALQVTESDQGVDVQVNLVASEDSFFTGASTVHFNRNDIRLMFSESGARIENEGELTDIIIADLLNALGGTSLSVEDFSYVEEYTDGEESRGYIEIEANNLAWKGTLPVHVIPPWDFTPVVDGMTLISGTQFYRLNRLQATSKGPQGQGQPIDYFNLGTWKLDVTGGVCTLVDPSLNESTLTIPGIDLADHVDIGFDQNGGLLVVFTVAGNIKLYWYNPQAGQIQVDDFGPGVTPYISLTSYNTVLDSPEVLLTYARAGDLRYRRQNDRHDTEYSLAVDDASDILNTEFDILNRYVVEYFDSADEEVKNISTHSGSMWEVDYVPEAASEGELMSLVVRDGIVYPHEDELLPDVTGEGEIIELSTEYVEIHTPGDNPTELLGDPAVTAAIVDLQVTDGAIYRSAGEDAVLHPSRTINSVAVTTAPSKVEPESYDESVMKAVTTIDSVTVTTYT